MKVTASLVPAAAATVLATLVVLAGILPAQNKAKAARIPPRFNMQAQTACETKMLQQAGAREVFSGKAYEELTEVTRAYGRSTPHVYVFPGSINMFYIAGSASVEGRGKILVGQQAVEQFDAPALKGFLGHEMAHLVSDSGAHGCNDYVLRDPQTESAADALAARTVGPAPVKAFLQRVLVLTKGQNWEAKRRLELLNDATVATQESNTDRRPGTGS